MCENWGWRPPHTIFVIKGPSITETKISLSSVKSNVIFPAILPPKFQKWFIITTINSRFSIFEILKPKKIILCVQILRSRVPAPIKTFREDPLNSYRLAILLSKIKLYKINFKPFFLSISYLYLLKKFIRWNMIGFSHD